MNILFLSVSIGAGHKKAAEALKEAVLNKYPNSKAVIIDTLKYISPIIDKVIVGGYLNTLKSTPQIYKKIYDISESRETVYGFSKSINNLMSFKLHKLITEYRPALIVCTHPFPLQMIANLKSKGKVSVPLAAVLTDFVIHPFWMHNEVNAYIVANEAMKYEMIKKGIKKDLIYPVGIPLSSKFIEKKLKNEVLEKLSFKENIPTFLIMGGSLGFGKIKNIFISLLNLKNEVQIIVITGKNKKLKISLEAICKNRSNIKILSFTNRVAEIMDISDFIITKPGGMTISEALVKKLPIIIISPIPGQEERNAHFLMNNGVAVNILENDDAELIISQLLDNPRRIAHMKEMAELLSKPNSSIDATNIFDKLIHDQRDGSCD